MGEEETQALIEALQTVTSHVPDVVRGLEDGTLFTTKQVEFADLLIEVGQLLRKHAEAASVTSDNDVDRAVRDAPSDPLT